MEDSCLNSQLQAKLNSVYVMYMYVGGRGEI